MAPPMGRPGMGQRAGQTEFPQHVKPGDPPAAAWANSVVDVLRALGISLRPPLKAHKTGKATVISVDNLVEWITFRAPAGGIPARTGTDPNYTAGSADCYYRKGTGTTFGFSTGTATVKIYNDTAAAVTGSAEGKALKGEDGKWWVWTEVCP